MELTDLEIISLRKRIYEEVYKIPELKNNNWEPESRHFDIIKNRILLEIAYRIWEYKGKPKNNDIDIWLQSEKIWNLIRFGWD